MPISSCDCSIILKHDSPNLRICTLQYVHYNMCITIWFTLLKRSQYLECQIEISTVQSTKYLIHEIQLTIMLLISHWTGYDFFINISKILNAKQQLPKELSFCHKLRFSNSCIFVIQYRKPLFFQTMNSVRCEAIENQKI